MEGFPVLIFKSNLSMKLPVCKSNVEVGFNCSSSTRRSCCNTVLYRSITSIGPAGEADSTEQRGQREVMLGLMCREAWQTARPAQVETPARFVMGHTIQHRRLNWTHHSPSSTSLIPYITLLCPLSPSLLLQISISFDISSPLHLLKLCCHVLFTSPHPHTPSLVLTCLGYQNLSF